MYGKIVDYDGTPKAGVHVEAKWVDYEGSKLSYSTITIEQTAEGDKYFAGYYFFNKGFITARDDSTITIEADGIVRKVDANPGGQPVAVPVIVLDGGSSGGGGSGDGYDDYDWSPELDDLVSSVLPDDISEPGETEPSFFFGQLRDMNGTPLGGENVSLEWTDENNVTHMNQTKTLTKEEAEKLGNESLEGYYIFNRTDVKTEENSTVKIVSKTMNYTANTRARPGNKVRLNLGPPRPKGTGYERYDSSVENKEEEKVRISFLKKYLIPIIIVTVMIILTVLIIIYKRQTADKVQAIKNFFGSMPLRRELGKLNHLTAGTIMEKEITKINRNDSIHGVIECHIMLDIGSVVLVTDGSKIIGIITEKDLVRKIDFNSDLTKVPATTIMSYPIKTVKTHTTFEDIIRMFNMFKIRQVPVMRRGELVGLVTEKSIAKHYDRFFNEYAFDETSVPELRNIMVPPVFVKKSDNILGALNLIWQKDADCALVVEGGREGIIPIKSVEGILTERQVIEHLYNFPDNFENKSVQEIFNVQYMTISSNASAVDTNKLMLAKKLRRLIVVENGKVAGIVTRKEIRNSLNAFISSISSRDISVDQD